jgi:hypothetical protein
MMIMQPLLNVYTGAFSLAERLVPRVAATEPCRPYGRPFAAAKNCEFLDNSLERHDNRCRLMKASEPTMPNSILTRRQTGARFR